MFDLPDIVMLLSGEVTSVRYEQVSSQSETLCKTGDVTCSYLTDDTSCRVFQANQTFRTLLASLPTPAKKRFGKSPSEEQA